MENGFLRDSIKGLYKEYVGKKVFYSGKEYTVVDIGHDGSLLINKGTRDSEITAISTAMCRLAD